MLDPTETSKSNNSEMPTFQPMGVGGILDAALSLYRKHFRVFLGIAALYFIYAGVQEAIVIYVLENSAGTPTSDNFISDVDDLLGIFIGMLITGVLVVASSDIYFGRHITIRAALRHFCSRFSSYLGGSLVYVLPFKIVTLDSLEMSGGVALAILVCTPFLVYFLISWVFYGPAVLVEELTVGEALERSRALVRGTWGRVCGITLAILLFYTAIYYILANSFGVILALLGILRDGSLMETISALFGLKYVNTRPTSLTFLIVYVLYLGADTFTSPIYAIGVTLLYFDVRIRKEGFDIEMRASAAQTLDRKREL